MTWRVERKSLVPAQIWRRLLHNRAVKVREMWGILFFSLQCENCSLWVVSVLNSMMKEGPFSDLGDVDAQTQRWISIFEGWLTDGEILGTQIQTCYAVTTKQGNMGLCSFCGSASVLANKCPTVAQKHVDNGSIPQSWDRSRRGGCCSDGWDGFMMGLMEKWIGS